MDTGHIVSTTLGANKIPSVAGKEVFVAKALTGTAQNYYPFTFYDVNGTESFYGKTESTGKLTWSFERLDVSAGLVGNIPVARMPTGGAWQTTSNLGITGYNVGIDTAAPDSKFQVIATHSDGLEVATVAGAQRYRVLVSVDATSAYIDSYKLGVGAGGKNLCLNQNGGSVGIGTTPEAGVLLSLLGNAISVRPNNASAGQIVIGSGYGGNRGFVLANGGSGAYTSYGLISDGTDLYVKTAGYNIGNTSDLSTGWTTKVTFTAAGSIVCNTAGQGLKLPTAPGSADVAMLDCYVEDDSSFTPEFLIYNGSFITPPTYGTRTCHYTRIGRLVYVSIRISWSNPGAAAGGTYVVVSIPFAGGTVTDSMICVFDTGITVPANFGGWVTYPNPGGGYAWLSYFSTNNGQLNALYHSSLTSAGSLYINGVYATASS